MLPDELEALDRARPMIINHLDPLEAPFLEYLQSKRVFSRSDVELIRHTTNNRSSVEGTRKLLDIYYRKANSLGPLIEALTMCCYENMVIALTTPVSADSGTTSVYSKLASIGGVPRNPEIYVERPSLLDELRTALLEIGNGETGNWVVVHGMAGIGKSVLAAAVLLDPSVIGSNFTSVHWLDIGPNGDNGLLKLLQDLFWKLDIAERRLNFETLDAVKSKLREIFVSDCPKTLVILDDLWTENVARTFSDIRCNVLATTRQLSLLDKISPSKKFIHLPNSGFTWQEALTAFSKWSNLKDNALPEEAMKLYQHCQGHPFEISLIGSLLREYPTRWTYYSQLLKDRKLAEISKSTTYRFDSFVATANVSVEYLPDDVRWYFQSLGVFQRGSEISIKALMTFWQKEKITVEDIMGILWKRSLVERRRSVGYLESYRIHTLLHETTKMLNGKDLQKKLHQDLLDRYLVKAGGQWSRLPRDGYIYENVAYHLFRTEDPYAPWEIFLNLRFVIMHILQCGAVKTLTDYRRYQDYIRSKDETAFDAFQCFIKKNMHLLADEPMLNGINAFDRVLCIALTEPTTSTVRVQAMELNDDLRVCPPGQRADQSEDGGDNWEPVISLRYNSGSVNQAVWLPNNGTCACAFTCDDGTLRVCSTETGRNIIKIKLGRPAICLSVTSDSKRALVCCETGLFIYDLKELAVLMELDAFSLRSPKQDSKDEYVRTPSPLLNVWPHLLSRQVDSEETGCLGTSLSSTKICDRQYRWCSISGDGSKAITGDSDACLILWNLTGAHQTPHEIFTGHNGPITCCKFSYDDEFIVSCSEDGTAIVWKTKTRQQICVFYEQNKNPLSCCCWIENGPFRNCILTNSYAEFSVWSHNERKANVRLAWKTIAKATCMDVSKCGNYVAAGLVDCSIVVWQINQDFHQILSISPNQIPVVPTSMYFDNDTRLLVSRKDGTIQALCPY